MLTDSERFAFTAHRIHAFDTTGNAYDATQTDEAIETGDTLLVHAEGVVAVAMTWPFAVTTAHGLRCRRTRRRTRFRTFLLAGRFGRIAGSLRAPST